MNEEIVLIPAVVHSVNPDRVQWKPYATELRFDVKVSVLIPVPAKHVTKSGDEYILSLEGWAIFLDVYTTQVEKMHKRYTDDAIKGVVHNPIRIKE